MSPPLCRHGTCNFDVHVAVQQQILRLQVSVDDVAVVTILHRRQNLPELPPGLQLAEAAVLRQVVCSQTVEGGEVMCQNYIQIIIYIDLYNMTVQALQTQYKVSLCRAASVQILHSAECWWLC